MADRNIYRSAIQSDTILALLRSARGAWVPLPEILDLGIAQYNARIFELRERGLNIENRTQTVDGVRHSWFRLVDTPAVPAPAPVPSKPSQKWEDRPRFTGLPLFDLGVRP
jgi:helix-turn-helix protein